MSVDLFPLELPSSADLETAAQEMERKASEMMQHDLHGAALYFQAAAAYRLAFEERQTREALRAILRSATSKSLSELIFGKGRR